MANSAARVILTGANGYIGHYAIEALLNRGFEVHAFSRKKHESARPGITWHQVDLLSESTDQLMQQIAPTHLLHLAWETEHGKFWGSDKNSTWLQSSIALMKAFQRGGGTRFVTAGTCAEYDWGHGVCLEGTTPENPHTLYGIAKKEFTDTLLSFSKSTGMSAACGRIFFLYGPGEGLKRLLPSVVLPLLRGEQAKCSDGLQERDFMFVEDVAHALVSLLCSNVQGVVNIASGKPLTIQTFIQAAANEAGHPGDVIFGALPRSANDPQQIIASADRLESEVGYKPKISLEVGLARTLEWLRKINS